MAGLLGNYCTLIIICLLAAACTACPQYNVYSQRLEGEAELAKAEYSRQVAVREARPSATAPHFSRSRGHACRRRRKGQSDHGESLKDNEAYLRYLFVKRTREHQKPSDLLPTEAQLPILNRAQSQVTVCLVTSHQSNCAQTQGE